VTAAAGRVYDRSVPSLRNPGRPIRAALPVAALALGGAAAPALAVPAVPSSPADAAFVDTQRPTFGWTRGTVDANDRYEIWVEGVGKVAELPASVTPRTVNAAVDLPDDKRLTWFVRIVHVTAGGADGATEDTAAADRRDIRISTPPPAPTITDGPAGPTSSATPSFSWSGTRVSSTWTLTDANGSQLQTASPATASGQATMAALTDGSYVFRVVQRNLEGKTSPQATRPFTVDTVAPGILSITANQATPGVTPTPSFRWTGLEAGATSAWRVTGSGGVTVEGPTVTPTPAATVGPLPAGSYVFEARQSDAAGNPGPWQSEPFAVLPSPAAPVAASSNGRKLKLPVRNPKRLTPRVGARVSSTRPVLRWKGAPSRTRLFNVQVFKVVGKTTRLRKVLTAFPTASRYRIPKKHKLAKGSCYVWRVWPYRGSSFTVNPLGVSHFCVRAK
jgi:hypothetical protein